jgi:hypothetical protein
LQHSVRGAAKHHLTRPTPHDTSRRAEEYGTLSNIYNWFTEGFDTADLKDAKVLLDELDSKP